MFENFMEWLRELLGLPDEIDSVVKPAQRAQKKLTKVSQRQKVKAHEEDRMAVRITEHAAFRRKKAERAEKLAKAYKTLAES